MEFWGTVRMVHRMRKGAREYLRGISMSRNRAARWFLTHQRRYALNTINTAESR